MINKAFERSKSDCIEFCSIVAYVYVYVPLRFLALALYFGTFFLATCTVFTLIISAQFYTLFAVVYHQLCRSWSFSHSVFFNLKIDPHLTFYVFLSLRNITGTIYHILTLIFTPNLTLKTNLK